MPLGFYSATQPLDNPGVREAYAQWLGGEPGTEPAVASLHTQYHAVEATIIPHFETW